MGHRRSPETDGDLDAIVVSIAEQGGTFAAAERLVSDITERFYLLSEYPYLGRARDEDLGPGRRSLPVDGYIIIYRIESGDVVILRVIHGRRDVEALLR